jgi:hypothetical protein
MVKVGYARSRDAQLLSLPWVWITPGKKGSSLPLQLRLEIDFSGMFCAFPAVRNAGKAFEQGFNGGIAGQKKTRHVG